MTYAFPEGGLPGQDKDPVGKAVFTTAYAVIPAGVMRDIVTSNLPGWQNARAWILARPLSGFAETFAQYAVEIAPGGGATDPEPDKRAQNILFVAEGDMGLTLDGQEHRLSAGGYAYVPAGTRYRVKNRGDNPLKLHLVRKSYEEVDGIAPPAPFVTSDQTTDAIAMPDAPGWKTTRFVDPGDMAHDCHVNIVTLEPGARIPFAETHVMEHGLYVLQGNAQYLLNQDWVDVGPGDFMWLRAFCPQACIVTGDETFRYLLYKDVNRHPKLQPI